MATGYTHRVQNGEVVEVKDYILNCARQFGALMHMREDNSTDIKYREVGDYHLKSLNKASDNLEQLKKMTDEDIKKEIDKNYEERIKSINRSIDKQEKDRERYLNMIEKVNEWNPPTKEHLNLKEFAIKQLQESIKHDCENTYIQIMKKELRKETISEYRDNMMKLYSKEIEYHNDSYQKEIAAVEGVNKWISDLVNSFN